jgi:hypothetical protein
MWSYQDLFIQEHTMVKNGLQKVFAIAGLDRRTISCKSLISFSSGLTLIIKRQMLASTITHYSTSGTSVTEHRISCIANTDSLVATQ